METEKQETKMLSGWKSFTWGLSVLGLFAAALLVAIGGPAAAIACVGGSLTLMLLSAVLEWMGEVEHHLRRIADDADRSVDRLNTIIGKLEAQERDRHIEAVARAAQQSSNNPARDFMEGK